MTADAVKSLADAVRKWREPGVLAILAYGSCLREDTTEGLIDLYVLTDSDAAVSPNRFARFFARLLPPNVYYFEMGKGAKRLRAKVAVLSLPRFARLAAAETKNPYIWARFGQPARLVYARSVDVRADVEKALETASATLWRNAAMVSHAGEDALGALTRLFMLSYATELRPESEGRARLIVEADKEFYRAAAAKYLGPQWKSSNRRPHRWRLRRLAGKILSIGRLIKAGFTFKGGADYMAWKIARHSGVVLTISPWQRRHPILGALMLLPQVLRGKGLR